MFSAVSISAVAQVNSLGYQLTYTFKGTVYDSLLAAENAMREDAGATVTVDAYGNKSYAGNYPSFDNSTNGASPA